LAGARETFVTTTGGPEHFLADPAINDTSADDPVVLERADRLDGDDIVVEPAAPGSGSRRIRLVIAGAIAAVLVVGGIAIAVANRNHPNLDHPSSVRSVQPVSPPAHPTPPRAITPKQPVTPQQPAAQQPKPPAAINKTAPVPVAPPAIPVAPAPATPPVASPTPPPVTTPPVEPASVLRWTANPAALSVTGGAHAIVTITVANPTKGIVTLGTPLSCPPTVRGPHGAVFGSVICAQITQTVQPKSTLTQRYTIYATDTGDASGQALPPGVYTASFENLFKIKVNVTKS
jgi:hypothetical protein